jgi:VWFA-related protein
MTREAGERPPGATPPRPSSPTSTGIGGWLPIVGAVALATGLSAVDEAWQTPAGSQEPPVFRADIDVVRLDVTVLDRDRKPMRDLTAADFTVTEDGRPQRIVAVTEIRASENDPVLTPRMRFVARDVTANDMVDRLGDGRVFVLILDDFNIPFDDDAIVRLTRETARYTIDSLGPSDVAAIVFPYEAGKTVEFTDDRQKLLQAIDTFKPAERSGFTPRTPQGMGPTEGDIVQRWAPSLMRTECQRSQPMVPVVETVMRRLSGIQNRRKTVVLFSTGVPMTVAESRGCPGELAQILRDAFGVAARSNINIYTVDPAGYRGYEEYLQHPLRNMRGPFFPRAMDPMQAATVARRHRDFLETVSDNTGGQAIVNSDNPEVGLDRMFAEDGSYYLVGYQSSNTRADGRFRQIKVTVNRPGAEVRARSGYYAARPGELARTDRGRGASANELGLSGMRSPTGVSLRTVLTPVAPAAATGRDVTVGAVLTLGYPASSTLVREQVTITRNTYDADGRASPPVQERIALELEPAGIDGQRRSFYYALRLPPGRHQVRFEVRSAALDRASSIVGDVEVPDFSRARLSTSGLLLGIDPAGGTAAETAFGELLPIVPTSEREFAANAKPIAFLRLFQGAAAARVPVRVRAEIIDGRDATLFEASEVLPPEAFSDPKGAIFQTPLSFERLERGPHILSVTAEATGAVAVRRDLLFRIR